VRQGYAQAAIGRGTQHQWIDARESIGQIQERLVTTLTSLDSDPTCPSLK
jgi:hypothetical protein